MTTEEMRRRISAVYNGLSWKKKVANMPERQVYAVFKQFEKSGKFKTQAQLDALKVKNRDHNDGIVSLEDEKYGHQMNISDMWPENLIMSSKNTNKMEEI